MILEVPWDGLWTLSFWALTISWSRPLARVWSGPYDWQAEDSKMRRPGGEEPGNLADSILFSGSRIISSLCTDLWIRKCSHAGKCASGSLEAQAFIAGPTSHRKLNKDSYDKKETKERRPIRRRGVAWRSIEGLRIDGGHGGAGPSSLLRRRSTQQHHCNWNYRCVEDGESHCCCGCVLQVWGEIRGRVARRKRRRKEEGDGAMWGGGGGHGDGYGGERSRGRNSRRAAAAATEDVVEAHASRGGEDGGGGVRGRDAVDVVRGRVAYGHRGSVRRGHGGKPRVALARRGAPHAARAQG